MVWTFEVDPLCSSGGLDGGGPERCSRWVLVFLPRMSLVGSASCCGIVLREPPWDRLAAVSWGPRVGSVPPVIWVRKVVAFPGFVGAGCMLETGGSTIRAVPLLAISE